MLSIFREDPSVAPPDVVTRLRGSDGRGYLAMAEDVDVVEIRLADGEWRTEFPRGRTVCIGPVPAGGVQVEIRAPGSDLVGGPYTFGAR